MAKGDLSREFSNFSPQAKTLAWRLSRGVYRHDRRPAEPRIRDSCGPLVRSIGTAQTFLDAAQVDELVAMYVGGKIMREIAEHFGVHRTMVAIHLRRRGVPVRRGKLTGEQVAEIGNLYEQGFTLAEIGRRFSVGQDTVRRTVLLTGATIRPPGRRSGTRVQSVSEQQYAPARHAISDTRRGATSTVHVATRLRTLRRRANGGQVWADNETDLDLLGFDFLVDGLVVALTEPRLLPLTVGVLGDWGSGKSSLMRIASAELTRIGREESGSDEGDESRASSPYLTIDFSPWQYEDYEDVKVALMTTVLDALEARMPSAIEELRRLRAFVAGLKHWGRRLGRVGSSAAPTVIPLLLQTTVPDAGPELTGLVTALSGAVAKEAQTAFAQPESEFQSTTDDAPLPLDDIKQFRKEFGQLVDRLPDTDAVIVFIDDLDRCLPETVVDTFEAIRLFLNTPKTAYVLALNQNVVESAIDSRYPDLRKLDGGGIGRDYLEKMLQLKIVIPPLSAPEAETYVNLLFAELHLQSDQFAKALEVTNTNRATNGLSVAFNPGIAGAALEDIPSDLAKDLAWAADITPVLGSSLRGNPRQLKRFLNNLLLKHRSAARREIELELPILAKLMVLEDQYNTDFQKVFDWEMSADGKCPELIQAEDYARAKSEPRPTTVHTEDATDASDKISTKPTISGKTISAQKASPEQLPSEAEAWAEKVHIGEWLRVEPSLKQVDLRPYFTYSRDKLSFGVSASRLAPHLQQLLTQVQSDIEQSRRSHYPTVASLDASERAQFIEALLERVQRHPASTALTAILELAEVNSDIVQPVCESLRRVPPMSIPAGAGTAAVRRLPGDNSAVVSLLDHWESSDNTGLRTIVRSGRQAKAKKGTGRGNLG